MRFGGEKFCLIFGEILDSQLIDVASAKAGQSQANNGCAGVCLQIDHRFFSAVDIIATVGRG